MDKKANNYIIPIVFLVSFSLHFMWEMWQISFYLGMAEAKHSTVVWLCTQATIGDSIISTIAYLAVAYFSSFDWLLKIERKGLLAYIFIGLLVTIIIEILSTQLFNRWAYSDKMPMTPFLDVGIMPLAQWVVLPIIIIQCSKIFVFGLTGKNQG